MLAAVEAAGQVLAYGPPPEKRGNEKVRAKWFREFVQGVVDRIAPPRDITALAAESSRLADSGFWLAVPVVARSTPAAVLGTALHAMSDYGSLPVTQVLIDVRQATPERVLDLTGICAVRGVGVLLDARAYDVDSADVTAHVDQVLGLRTLVEGEHAHAQRPGVILAADIRRTVDLCRELGDGRVRIVRGRKDPDGGARFSSRAETDKAFVRCARVLIQGQGHPCFATRQAKLIEVIRDIAQRSGRQSDSYEFGFDIGQREAEQRRLLDGHLHVRVSLTAAADLLAVGAQ
jgi:hypothetical protein